MAGIATVSPPFNWLRIDSRHACSAGARILRRVSRCMTVTLLFGAGFRWPPFRHPRVSVSLRRLIGGLRRRGIRSVPPPPTQGQEKRAGVGEAVGLGLHPRDHGLLIGLLGTQQR